MRARLSALRAHPREGFAAADFASFLEIRIFSSILSFEIEFAPACMQQAAGFPIPRASNPRIRGSGFVRYFSHLAIPRYIVGSLGTRSPTARELNLSSPAAAASAPCFLFKLRFHI